MRGNSQRLRDLSISLVPILTICSATQAATTNSACVCGYSVNSTNSTSSAIFTELLETDFLHLSTIRDNNCWTPQEYNVTAIAGRGPYGKEATLDNVVPNPLPVSVWEGQGVGGTDPGMKFWVNSTLQGTPPLVPMGEISSVRQDMLYGSFRVGMKLTGVPGTCGAFFWYRNNSEEIDMEFLSSSFNSSSQPLYLVMQTTESDDAGYNAEGTSTYNIVQLPFAPSQGFHEYRFDWTPNKASFYADSNWLQDFYWTYPKAPGHLSVNHWSNGNALWSEGPPAQNAVLTVSYVKAYFNTSNDTIQAQYASTCAGPLTATQICQIPDQTIPPDPSTSNGETFFFNRGMCGEDMKAGVSTSSTRTSTSTNKGAAAPTQSGKVSEGNSVSSTVEDLWFVRLNRVNEMALAAGFGVLVLAFFL